MTNPTSPAPDLDTVIFMWVRDIRLSGGFHRCEISDTRDVEFFIMKAYRAHTPRHTFPFPMTRENLATAAAKLQYMAS